MEKEKRFESEEHNEEREKNYLLRYVNLVRMVYLPDKPSQIENPELDSKALLRDQVARDLARKALADISEDPEKLKKLKSLLDPAISRLSQNEQEVIKKRYGLENEETLPKDITKVANEMNLMRARIQNQERKSFSKLKHFVPLSQITALN